MNDNEHVTAIKQAARDLAQGNIWATDTYIETVDSHTDDLATELDEANARAGLQLERAERLAEAILGLCEGTSDDIEDELGLHPMDLRDQTADLDAAPSTTEGETQP